ncbi:YdcH family protein [Sphingomonas sp.]|uniref:YdcH family protein n=1 Tax=Sphingomonas sp. TaxID=28214 RepID=UPI0031CF03BF
MQNAHLSALEAKHATLDRRINVESQRPLPDQMIIADLKRQKLRVKEEIAHL